MRFLSVGLIILIAAYGWAMPAQAQSKQDMIDTDAVLTQRLNAIEQRYLTGDPAAERLMQRMDALEASHRIMTGEIEQLRYERETLQTEVQSLSAQIADLQSLAGEMRQHLQAVELAAQSGGSVLGGSALGSSAPSTTPYVQPDTSYGTTYGDSGWTQGSYDQGSYDQNIYSGGDVIIDQSATYAAPTYADLAGVDMGQLQELGRERLLAGDFSGAQSAFKQYIDLNPDADDIGEAHFWLAETYFVRSGYAEAVDAYIAAMRAAPAGEKAPNALVGLAASLRGLGDIDGACQTLDGFDAEYAALSGDVARKAKAERQRAGCS